MSGRLWKGIELSKDSIQNYTTAMVVEQWSLVDWRCVGSICSYRSQSQFGKKIFQNFFIKILNKPLIS